MTEEAEKVINLSLYKMAESRTIRRGTSLHKHLLIASVLTKARSAYLENWFDGASTIVHSASGSSIRPGITISSAMSSDEDDDGSLNNNHILDPRFFVEVESEIELPSDILNCVEKLGDIGDVDGFMSGEPRTSASEEAVDTDDPTAAMILSDVVVDIEEDICESTVSVPSDKLTYLDLDAARSTCSSSASESFSSLSYISAANASNGVVIEPVTSGLSSVSYTTSVKRRRGWSLTEDDDDSTAENEGALPEELNEKLRKNGVSVINMAKRLRISKEGPSAITKSLSSNDPTTSQDSFRTDSSRSEVTTTNNFEPSGFRTKKSHFEVEASSDEEDDDDDDSFLADDLGGASRGDQNRNDRRVPSASSSGSCSDEEAEAMEVDQLTNLVHYFSFKQKQQAQTQMHTTSSSLSTNSETPTRTGLIRSMSTPDLCNRSSSSVTGNNSSTSVAEDLFTSYNSSHRVLTMTV